MYYRGKNKKPKDLKVTIDSIHGGGSNSDELIFEKCFTHEYL